MKQPILLFQPPGYCRTFTRSGSSYPPLGLCQLAATLPPSKAVVLDADGEDWSEEETKQELRERGFPLCVGMTATSYTLEIIEYWASYFKKRGVRVLVGGPHASLEPKHLLQTCPSVEAAFRGEAEEVFPAIVARIEGGQRWDGLPGIVTKSQGDDVDLVRVGDLSTLAFPRLDGLPIENYSCPDAKRTPMVTMMTARGCPHRCGFCSSPLLLGKKVREWEVFQVLNELEKLVQEYGIQEVSFVDDVFTIRKKRALDLCLGIVDRGLDLSWFCNARADQITPTLAQAMAQAGCHQAYLGFESGSQMILDKVQKGTSVAKLKEGAIMLAEAGVARSVGFVFGLPGDTDQTIEQSIELAHEIQPERLQFTRWTPLPGTPLAKSFEGTSSGFHAKDKADKVTQWIERGYRSVEGLSWGKRSW